MNRVAEVDRIFDEGFEYYAIKYSEGVGYQRFITEWFAQRGVVFKDHTSQADQYDLGENSLGMEIKRDGLFRKTGNLYIKVEEKTHQDNPNFVRSGIHRGDSWLYCIGDERTFWIFATKDLVRWMKIGKFEMRPARTGTAKGFLFPVKHADRYCAVRIDVSEAKRRAIKEKTKS